MEENLWIFSNVTDIGVCFCCILGCADVEEKVAGPDVNFGGTWAEGHIGLEIDEALVYLAEEQKAFGSVKVYLGDFVITFGI